MNGDYLTPPARPSDDALTFAAFLEAWPGLIVVLMLFGPAMASINGTADVVFETLLLWLSPRELVAQDSTGLLLALVMPLAYLGPGLGRLYLRDWDGIFKYFGMRLMLIGGSVACFIAFVFLFFGSGGTGVATIAIIGGYLLAIAPLGVGLVSAWDLLTSRTATGRL